MSDEKKLIVDDAELTIDDYEEMVADWKSDYETLLKKLYEKDEKISELERHNELLRAELEKTLETIKAWWDSNFIYARYAGPGEMEDYVDTTERLQAAIDGGALDGEK